MSDYFILAGVLCQFPLALSGTTSPFAYLLIGFDLGISVMYLAIKRIGKK